MKEALPSLDPIVTRYSSKSGNNSVPETCLGTVHCMYDYCMIIIIDFNNGIYVKNTGMTNLET